MSRPIQPALDKQMLSKAETLIEALPYFQRYAGRSFVVKYGGHAMGDPSAQQSTPTPDERTVRTPWLQVDDVFYEARGTTWALLHFLRAIEHDFEPVLRDKNALVSLRQVIRELEESQVGLSSPVVLNGSPYGFFANQRVLSSPGIYKGQYVYTFTSPDAPTVANGDADGFNTGVSQWSVQLGFRYKF